MEDRWLSVTEVCEYLGVSRDTIYKWINTLNMPASRAGRRWKFKKDEVDLWMKNGGADDTLTISQLQTTEEEHQTHSFS
jgi:excisionase family DNA binding protein